MKGKLHGGAKSSAVATARLQLNPEFQEESNTLPGSGVLLRVLAQDLLKASGKPEQDAVLLSAVWFRI